MARKFAAKLTDTQFALARKIEAAGLASISQAVKAMERGDTAKVNEWKKQLASR
jgi:hypothetical protein